MKRNTFFPNSVNIIATVLSIIAVYLSGIIWSCTGFTPGQPAVRFTFMADVVFHQCFGNYLNQNLWIWVVVPVATYLVVSAVQMMMKNNKHATLTK